MKAPPLRRLVRRNVWLVSVYALLIFMLLYERLIRSSAFSSFDIQSLVDGAFPLALAAMAQACVVLTGGIDLSVGAVITLANVVAANWMLGSTFGESLAMSLAVLAGGAIVGVTTGLIVGISRVPDIIVTLATSAIIGGIALKIMPTPGGGAPQGFSDFLTGDVRSTAVPVGVVVLALLVLLVWLPVRRSRPGLAIFAMGSSRSAAFLSGVHVGRTRLVAYALGGTFSALAGLVLTAQTANGSVGLRNFLYVEQRGRDRDRWRGPDRRARRDDGPDRRGLHPHLDFKYLGLPQRRSQSCDRYPGHCSGPGSDGRWPVAQASGSQAFRLSGAKAIQPICRRSAKSPEGVAVAATGPQKAPFPLSTRLTALRRLIADYPLLVLLVVLAALGIATNVASPGFLVPDKFSTTLLISGPLGLLAAGETVVLLTGGIDLSITSTATIAAYFMVQNAGANSALSIIGALGIGLVIGIVNGIGIGPFAVSP